MSKGLSDVVDTTAPEYSKETAHGRGGYFLSPKELSKQQYVELKKICTELNSVVSVMGRKVELCDKLEGKSVFHLRIDCEGMEKKMITDFRAKLEGCGLDAQRHVQATNINMSFPGAYSSYTYIAIKGEKAHETFHVSPELSAFAESHPAERSACCNIL